MNSLLTQTLNYAHKYFLYNVPIKLGTAKTLKGYGRLVTDFDKEEVEIVTWPQTGSRPIEPGTGNEGGITEGIFNFSWKNNTCYAENNAVNRKYLTGWSSHPDKLGLEPVGPRQNIVTHEANYHPDGSQVFFPINGEPFVALLALPGDDVKPESFTAFYMDGSCGIHIHPGVWHQPVFPINDTASFRDKQGKVHACVCCDFPSEFGCFLNIPLQLSKIILMSENS